MGIERLKLSAGSVGVAIVGTVIHSAVLANGGYGAPTTPMLIGLGAGLVIGAAVIGRCWSQGRVVMAVLVGAALLAGEAYQLLMTAERTIAMRDARQAPIVAQAAAREKASQRLEEAAAGLAAITDTPRLTAALQAKQTADSFAVEKAAERGCAAHCRALLEQQVATATQEVEAARAEITALRTAARHELDSARIVLAALPVLGSASPLADRLGIPDWQFDLIAAVLIGIGANGLGAALVAFAAHGPSPASSRSLAVLAITESTPQRDATQEADRFACETFCPAPEGSISIAAIRTAYLGWCARNGIEPLPVSEIGAALETVFRAAGLQLDGQELRGIGWRPAIYGKP